MDELVERARAGDRDAFAALVGLTLDTVTWTGHGHLSITAPGFGAVIVSAGRTVVGPAGDVEFQAGPSQLDDYYGGDLTVVNDLCAALGTSNTEAQRSQRANSSNGTQPRLEAG